MLDPLENADITDAEYLNKLIFAENSSKYTSNPQTQEYIKKLGSSTVEELAKEPIRLHEDKQNVQDRTQELAISHYQTFIQTAECSRTSFNHFNQIEGKLNDLLEHIPVFGDKCVEFLQSSEDINRMRKLNTITIVKNAQLLEILELPQLMDSFVKDNLYEEALELAAYVYRLQNKHKDIGIMKSLVQEVDKLWLVMERQLIAQLSSDIQLPKCLQVIGHLRQMAIFSETELRLKFLQARNRWLEKGLKDIPNTDANQFLSKHIELTRVNLFSIITQYRAVFNDDEHSPLSTRNQLVNQNCIFFGWLRLKIDHFLRTLESNLPRVTSVDTILGQCMYFGLSFSKVGYDFRQLLAPIFLKTIEQHFVNALQNATSSFDSNIEKFTLINKIHTKLPTSWRSKSQDPLQPPDTLMEFYPLADYTNKLLAAFNNLRLCPALSVLESMTKQLERSLIAVAAGIFVLYEQEHQAFTMNSKDSFTRLCMCFADDLVPFVQKALHIIYPPSCVAQHLGINVQKLQDCGIGYLNREVIVAKIVDLLPGKVVSLQRDVKSNNGENEKVKTVEESVEQITSVQKVENVSSENTLEE